MSPFFYYSTFLPQPQQPLQEELSGQPIHFFPLFLALIIYSAAAPTITAIIPIAIKFSINLPKIKRLQLLFQPCAILPLPLQP